MKLIKLSATPSTNAHLKALLQTGELVDETVIWAHDQTQGKGQQGASWRSLPGQSLTISLFRRFDRFPARYQFYLNLGISIGVYQALSHFGLPELAVKWPNDILSEGKKLCGILVENQLDGKQLGSAVIGIGLNVNEASFPALPKATSMRLSTGRQFDLDEVCDILVTSVLREIRRLDKHTLAEFQAQYQKLLFRQGVESLFEGPDQEPFRGLIEGIDEQGRLLVRHLIDGKVHAYLPKQISLQY